MTDERRERYENELSNHPVYDKDTLRSAVDAVMAVADEEVHAVREQMRTAWWEMHQEIARLRTELSARSRRWDS